MNKEGFTLIELLAIPIVLNIIEETRESLFKESVNGIVRVANTKSIITPTSEEITYEYKDSSWK